MVYGLWFMVYGLWLSFGQMLTSAKPVSAVISYIIQTRHNFWINCIEWL